MSVTIKQGLSINEVTLGGVGGRPKIDQKVIQGKGGQPKINGGKGDGFFLYLVSQK